MQLTTFQSDLNALAPAQIVRKHLLGGPGFTLSDHDHFSLKEAVRSEFDVDYNDVVVVGSAKLGFSIKPGQRYRVFGEESDIDVAVVSTPLFVQVWRETHRYRVGGADWLKRDQFARYLATGWIRPDMLPNSSTFRFAKVWWDLFEKLTRGGQFGPYKIRGGLYHSWFFLEQYQMSAVQQCIEEVMA